MSVRGAIFDFLRSDLYEPHTLDAEHEYAEWRSPLGWVVRVSGPRDRPIVEILDPAGRVYLRPSPMTAEALDYVLP